MAPVPLDAASSTVPIVRVGEMPPEFNWAEADPALVLRDASCASPASNGPGLFSTGP